MKRLLYLVTVISLLNGCSLVKNGNKIAQGEITSQFLAKNYTSWYNNSYNSYSMDTTTLNNIPNSFSNTTNSIEIFMGTWCSDSQRETPRIIKILEYLKFTNYKIYGLDTDKKSKQGFENDKNILRVPTIIIYSNNKKEINRIVEFPVNSLEKDLLEILTSTTYKPNYFE